MSSSRSRRPARILPHLLRAALLACAALPLVPAAAQVRGAETGERVLPVDVTVNGGPGGIWPIVSRDGMLYAPVEAFAAWRLQARPDTPTISYRGLRYFPVAAVTGIETRLDEAKGVLELSVPADAFTATRLTRELASVLPRSPTVPAAFVNYDLNFSRTGGPVPTRGLGLLGEVGTSGSWGVLTQTFVAPNLAEGEQRGVTRLETSYRRDFPEQGYTLIAGDSIFRTGLLGRNAYFGGLQFGTNFGLAPYINRQPAPLVAGETRAPSTVQLYVNDVLRQTSRVPAGPFTIENVPVMSGNGDITVRVRDILGRETVLTQPFLITAELLADGLDDWSVEIGKLREGLGAKSWDYGEAFATGMWRRGLSNTTTGEARLELAQGRTVAGLAGVHAAGSQWLLRGGAMASRHENLGNGARWLLGVERPGYTTTIGASAEGSTRDFRSLGEDDASVPVRLQLAAQASWAGDWGRLGLALAHQQTFDQEAVSTYSLTYGTTLRNNWQLSAFYTQAFGQADGFTVGASLVIPLDRRTVTSTSVQFQQDRAEFYSSITRSPEHRNGWAWRGLVAHQGEGRAEAGATYLSPHGLFTAEAAWQRARTDLRLGAVGGALWTQNRLFALRRFESSAAIVSVPGYEGVGVGIGSQATTRTDGGGMVLLESLNAYQKNPVRLDANDLPISAEIESIEQDIVPPWRSVARVQFDVRGGKAALVTLVLDDGQPAPAGATLRIAGEDREFFVARRGEAYVTGLKADNRLQMQWRDQRCDLELSIPPGAPEIARVGPLRCQGVAR